jgi:hypothetical protein
VAPLLAPYLALRGYGCLQKSAPPPASRGRLDLRSCVAADAPRASIGNGYIGYMVEPSTFAARFRIALRNM